MSSKPYIVILVFLSMRCGLLLPLDNSSPGEAQLEISFDGSWNYNASQGIDSDYDLEQVENQDLLGEERMWKPFHNFTSPSQKCRVVPIDPHTYDIIRDILNRRTKLLEYNIVFENHTVNPLLVNITYTYKANHWGRIGTGQGRTLLSLIFNYGVLSLKTLTFGVDSLEIMVKDEPAGCIMATDETEKVDIMMDISLRDFRALGRISLREGESVCHQVILNNGGRAQFADRCCGVMRGSVKGVVGCNIETQNVWLKTIDYILGVVTFIVLLFGPLLTPRWMYSAALDTVPYIVKLKEPLLRTMCIVNEDDPTIMRDHKLVVDDTTNGFENCRKLTKAQPKGKILHMQISEYRIYVNYQKLMVEHVVPVGITESLTRSIFGCKVAEVGPFKECCNTSFFGYKSLWSPVHWIDVCKVIGKILMVFFFPFPFYLRLVMYYMFEHPEIISRQAACSNLGLKPPYEQRLMQYLTPTHPLLLTAYTVYFTVGILLAIITSVRKQQGSFHRILVNSARDMHDFTRLSALHVLVSNCIFPFKLLGVFGIVIGIVYWPIVIPLTIVVCLWYCLPSIYLTSRLIINSLNVDGSRQYGRHNKILSQIEVFEVNRMFCKNKKRDKDEEDIYLSRNTEWLEIGSIVFHLILACVSVLTLCSVLLLVTICVSYLVQLLAFTLMGIIVNASSVLKYGSLAFLIIFYFYNTFTNVYHQYLELNKVIFSEVKDRNRDDINEFTSQPSDLQKNQGFKTSEASEQGEHEETDDICKKPTKHWTINDLTLFIDNDDNPKIPRALFEQVCQVRVAGMPGPVYLSFINATSKFLMILLFIGFVFIVVLSFGESYQVSSTNQMLATMAGGFMPLMFRHLLRQRAPGVEAKSVSFRAKFEEIIRSFSQTFPMEDFTFEEAQAEYKSGEEDSNDETKEKDKKTDSKSKEKKQRNVSRLFGVTKHGESAQGNFVDILLIVKGKDANVKVDLDGDTDPCMQQELHDLALTGNSNMDSK